MPLELPDRVAGVRYERGVNRPPARPDRLHGGVRSSAGSSRSGAEIVTEIRRGATELAARPVAPADLVEEVLRLEGLASIPSELPSAPAGRGLTSRSGAAARCPTCSPKPATPRCCPSRSSPAPCSTVSAARTTDPRRRTLRVVNPIDNDRPELASTLLPGLLDAVVRNVARGMIDVALYHVGQVGTAGRRAGADAEVGVDARPSDQQIQALLDALPRQPVHVAVALAGARERPGWWGPGARRAGRTPCAPRTWWPSLPASS